MWVWTTTVPDVGRVVVCETPNTDGRCAFGRLWSIPHIHPMSDTDISIPLRNRGGR